MLTSLTGNISFWIVLCTALMGLGAYKLITKQNSEHIKGISEKIDSFGEKIDDFRMETKLEQVRTQTNFEHMNDKMQSSFQYVNEKINRIEKDSIITREKINDLSEATAKIQVKLQSIDQERYKHELV